MRRLLLVLVLAAGCGSTNTKTVTAPAETKTVQQTPAECRAMGKQLISAIQLELSAAKGYAHLILPAYRAGVYNLSVTNLLAKENRQTDKIGIATKRIKAATALVGRCFG